MENGEEFLRWEEFARQYLASEGLTPTAALANHRPQLLPLSPRDPQPLLSQNISLSKSARTRKSQQRLLQPQHHPAGPLRTAAGLSDSAQSTTSTMKPSSPLVPLSQKVDALSSTDKANTALKAARLGPSPAKPPTMRKRKADDVVTSTPSTTTLKEAPQAIDLAVLSAACELTEGQQRPPMKLSLRKPLSTPSGR